MTSTLEDCAGKNIPVSKSVLNPLFHLQVPFTHLPGWGVDHHHKQYSGPSKDNKHPWDWPWEFHGVRVTEGGSWVANGVADLCLGLLLLCILPPFNGAWAHPLCLSSRLVLLHGFSKRFREHELILCYYKGIISDSPQLFLGCYYFLQVDHCIAPEWSGHVRPSLPMYSQQEQ